MMSKDDNVCRYSCFGWIPALKYEGTAQNVTPTHDRWTCPYILELFLKNIENEQ